MTLRGRVEHGTIVLDEPVRLPEGAQVVIQFKKPNNNDPTGIAGSWIDNRSADEIIDDIYRTMKSKK